MNPNALTDAELVDAISRLKHKNPITENELFRLWDLEAERDDRAERRAAAGRAGVRK